MEGIQFYLLIIQVIVAILMIILVLAQKSDGDSLSGLSSSSAGLNSAISGRASISILNKITMFLIALFMINCLVLASLSKKKTSNISAELQQIIQEQENQKNSDNSINKTSSSNPVETPKVSPKVAQPIVPEVD